MTQKRVTRSQSYVTKSQIDPERDKRNHKKSQEDKLSNSELQRDAMTHSEP